MPPTYLWLIAGVISGCFAGVSNTGVKQAERSESPHEPKAAEDVEAQPEHLRNQKDNSSGALPSPFKDTIDDEMLLWVTYACRRDIRRQSNLERAMSGTR